MSPLEMSGETWDDFQYENPSFDLRLKETPTAERVTRRPCGPGRTTMTKARVILLSERAHSESTRAEASPGDPTKSRQPSAAFCLLKAQGSHPPEGRGRVVSHIQNTLPSSEKLHSAAIYLIEISG